MSVMCGCMCSTRTLHYNLHVTYSAKNTVMKLPQQLSLDHYQIYSKPTLALDERVILLGNTDSSTLPWTTSGSLYGYKCNSDPRCVYK